MDEVLLEHLLEYGTSLVYEAAGQVGGMDHTIRPLYPGARLCGRALTVRTTGGDNLAIHRALALAEPGTVLVVDVGGYLDAGHWGEITTACAQARGLRGAVINGSVRDVLAIKGRRFPIFAAGVCMRAAGKAILGEIGVPIMCGGVEVSPGDLVLGDEDGVLVLPPQRLPGLLRAVEERRRREVQILGGIEAGRTTIDLLGLAGSPNRSANTSQGEVL